MINFKITGFAAGAAFILSFLVGLLSGGNVIVVLVRALIFAVIFFVLSGGIHLLITRFLPELLEETRDEPGFEEALTGSKINIMEAGIETPVFGEAEPAEVSGLVEDIGDGELGNIADLTGGASKDAETAGMDQGGQGGYTERGMADNLFSELSSPGLSSDEAEKERTKEPLPLRAQDAGMGSFGASGSSDAVDTLPDLEAMAGSFSTPGEEDEGDTDFSPPPPKPSPHGKAQSLKGDFNPKDIAEAIRTKLKREG
jgi:hypothetical protein